MKTPLMIIPFVLAAAGASANPAVSEPNGKLDSAFANLDAEDAWINSASFSMPIAESLGLQIDALQTHTSDSDFTGIGGHLFWRDHEVGLFGITAGSIWGDDIDSYEFGLEAEYYVNQWLTIGARAGHADIDYDTPFFFSNFGDDDGLYGVAYLTAYPHEDLALSLRIEQRFDRASVSIGAEYDLPIENLTAFAEGMWGEEDYEHAMIGLRYYFGSDKSLRERHRQDDPPNILQSILYPMQPRPVIVD